jgi:hypothetical protein
LAITFATDTDESISLEQFVHEVESILDSDDQDTLVALAPRLRRLANNRTFLAEFINDELANWEQFQKDSSYTGQVFQLATGRDYLIRANVWEPPAATVRGNRDGLFMYQQPHDHNFSFLTAGYLGAGYQTTIYECDPASVSGIPGDQVDMTFLETTRLPQGKVMLYRASRDIHCQEYAAEYSISLNLLVSDSGHAAREQFYFDFDSRRIVSVMTANPGHRRLNCYLARFVGDTTTMSKLDTIRRVHPLPRVRLTATESLAVLVPDEANEIWGAALLDQHAFVRDAARRVLDQRARGQAIDSSQSMAL